MTSSGAYAFNPSISDIGIEAFERIGIRSPELTPEHMYSLRMSCNLVLSDLANTGVNLWKVDLQTVPAVQGVTTYNVPSSTVMILDAYIRQYAMNAPVNLTPAFSTTSSSPTVTVTFANNGLSVGEYCSIIIPVSVGGLILYGFYQVVSVTSVNTFTITASANATSSTSGGAVPVFTTTATSATVSVNLPNHGYLAGQTFSVQIATAVGGITLFGDYTIAGITDANNFTITASYAAGSSATAAENGGQCQIAAQQQNTDPIDRIISPISRTDYAALPDKLQQGFPSVYWFDRLLNPTITIWQVPDGNGPYSLSYYRVSQIQDANPQSGQTADIPYRFQEAFASGVAWHLARKWRPQFEAQRKTDATEAIARAIAEDREAVSLMLAPDTDEYFR